MEPDATEVPFMDWPELASSMDWRQGEHVALVGPTGAGKTVGALALTELRGHVLMFSTKPADATLGGLRRQGWRTIGRWPPPATVHRAILHAPLTDLEADPPKVGALVREAINGAYQATSWCLVLDDLQALNTTCGLASSTRTLLLNARSSRVSCVVGTQRPRWVPREVWTQCTHLFIWRCTDRDDLRQLSGLGSANTELVRQAVAGLSWPDHHVLYVNTRTGRLVITKFPAP